VSTSRRTGWQTATSSPSSGRLRPPLETLTESSSRARPLRLPLELRRNRRGDRPQPLDPRPARLGPSAEPDPPARPPATEVLAGEGGDVVLGCEVVAPLVLVAVDLGPHERRRLGTLRAEHAGRVRSLDRRKARFGELGDGGLDPVLGTGQRREGGDLRDPV